MRANASPARMPARDTGGAGLVVRARVANASRSSSGSSSMPIVDRHWLRCASSASTLRSTCVAHVSTWLTRSASNSSRRRRPVRRKALLGEEVGIAGRDDRRRSASCPACVVIGMQAVRCHGSCPSTTSGRTRRMTAAHRGAWPRGRRPTRRRHSRGTRRRRRRAPWPRRVVLPRAARRARARSAEPSQRALRAVGADAHRHVRAGVGPLGERRAAAELDVVGVRADREHAPGAGRSTVTSCRGFAAPALERARGRLRGRRRSRAPGLERCARRGPGGGLGDVAGRRPGP